jgi:DNA-binding response OmpR family regulator
MRLLIVEDNLELAENIQSYLQLERYNVEIALNGLSAWESLQRTNYDCLVLDWNLPDIDGIELCQRIRSASMALPVLILTARSSKFDVVTGLSAGADDYLRKPFEMEELVARVNALIRRNRQLPNPVFDLGHGIVVDLNKNVATKNGKPVKLSPKEYMLLEYLILNANKVQDRMTILEHVWGNEEDELMFSQTIDVHVAYLRKKLTKSIIKTVVGGYLVEIDHAKQT